MDGCIGGENEGERRREIDVIQPPDVMQPKAQKTGWYGLAGLRELGGKRSGQGWVLGIRKRDVLRFRTAMVANCHGRRRGMPDNYCSGARYILCIDTYIYTYTYT